MSDVFTPQLFQGLGAAPALQAPALDAPVSLATSPMAAVAPAPAPVQPAPTAAPQTVFVPVPIIPKPAPKPRGLQISAEAVRKAQGIYPTEAREKQAMVDNAKAPPAPTGAWGAPE